MNTRLDLLNEGRIGFSLRGCWVPRAVSGEYLDKGDTTPDRYVGRYIRRNREIWRILSPEVRDFRLALIPLRDSITSCKLLSTP